VTTQITDADRASGAVTNVWMPAAAPLITRWAKDVSPQSARPEYPRPASRRSQWKSLNGLWKFALDSPERFDREILVPFPFESALSGLGLGKEVHERIAYKRSFTVPRAWTGKRIFLNFGAVDWEATVLVNGQEVGRHRGGYTPFSFDITDLLRSDREQELEIQVWDPAAYNPHAFGMIPKHQAAFQPMGKQLGSVGIWYTRCTGIWQSVWLEPLDKGHIAEHHFIPDLEHGVLTVNARLRGDAEKLSIKVFREGKVVASGEALVNGEQISFPVTVPNVEAWSPEQPHLYDVMLTLKKGSHTVDRVRTYCAFRSLSVSQGRILLNGQPYMLRGVLDQGYWPDGIYCAPTEEALREDVMQAKRMGFNTIRKHAKIEEPLFYYLCDQLGLLVVQDMPSSQDLSSKDAKGNFVNEWSEAVRCLWNHPCIGMWVPFNENWGNPGAFQDEVVDFTRALDGTRLIVDASGWTQRSKTDIIDHHDYTNDLAQYARENPPLPQWIGEYGGIALPVEGHTWMRWWGYQSVKSPSKLLQKAKFLTRQITENPGFSGFCFTQLCDVEQELNGLMTYDRIPKVPVEKAAELFAG